MSKLNLDYCKESTWNMGQLNNWPLLIPKRLIKFAKFTLTKDFIIKKLIKLILYIIIDGTTQKSQENQVVKIINRPHGSMNLLSRIHNQNLEEYGLTSGNFVRYMIDPKSGKITFYYRDGRENRWIKSTQKVEGKGLNLAPKENHPNSFVFRWIDDRSQSKIY